MIPTAYARVTTYVDRVIAWLPWLPRPGVTVDTTPGPTPRLFYRWNDRERAPYIVVPPDPWTATFPEADLRRVVTHEMGHLWVDAYSRRQGKDPYAALGVDPEHPQRHEIAAEILSRALGEAPSYPELESLSRPTPERVAFIERSGELPDRTAELIGLAVAVSKFWSRGDVPLWFRDYAPNFQRWLDLNVLEPLRAK